MGVMDIMDEWVKLFRGLVFLYLGIYALINPAILKHGD